KLWTTSPPPATIRQHVQHTTKWFGAMLDVNPFRDLIRRVRAGDEAAAAELVQHYEPYIRRAVRVRLVDPRLKRLVDSVDVCQSVLASFFVRAALGQYDLETPEQLLKLL